MNIRSEMLLDAKLIMRDNLARAKHGVSIDEQGRCPIWTDNLLPEIDPTFIESDLGGGAGRELLGKFRSAHSSAALAVNTFGFFRAAHLDVPIPGFEGLKFGQFEKTFSTGLSNRIPPHLDGVATSPDRVVGIESKCTEYLTAKVAVFSEQYFALEKPKGTAWFSEMGRVNESRRDYVYLDAAQLIKHALGLINCVDGPSTLLYIYWEPLDAKIHAPFAAHRAEIDKFAENVSGSGPSFCAISYPELWASWLASPEAPLRTHAERLFRRYEGKLGSYEGYTRVGGRKLDAEFFDDPYL